MSDPTLLAPIASAIRDEYGYNSELQRRKALEIARSIRRNPGSLTALYDAIYPDPPPCVVCGGPLTVASMGGGELTTYACQSPDARNSLYDPALRSEIRTSHYTRSEWVQRPPSVGEILTTLLGPES